MVDWLSYTNGLYSILSIGMYCCGERGDVCLNSDETSNQHRVVWLGSEKNGPRQLPPPPSSLSPCITNSPAQLTTPQMVIPHSPGYGLAILFSILDGHKTRTPPQ